jgi:hypothetical protein
MLLLEETDPSAGWFSETGREPRMPRAERRCARSPPVDGMLIEQAGVTWL